MKSPKPEIWYGLAVLVTWLDQASKLMLQSAFGFRESVVVTPYLNLVFVMNKGAAFSFLADAGGWQRWFFVVLALAISAWLVAMIRRHAHETLQSLAFSLVLGGALGNLFDRLRFGAVVDFIDFHVGGWHWPAFNVADSAISVGVALLLWQTLFHKEAPRD